MLTRWESIRLIPVSMPPHHHHRNKVFIFSILFTIFLFFLSFKLLLSLYFSFSLCSQIKKLWLWYYLFVNTHIMVDDDKILFISFFSGLVALFIFSKFGTCIPVQCSFGIVNYFFLLTKHPNPFPPSSSRLCR